MSQASDYQCIGCMDETITREFDVSHLSRICTVCGEFDRFVNTVVIERFNALAADPPAHLHWEQLDRTRQFLIAERLSRQDYSIEDFEMTGPDDESETPSEVDSGAEA